jgi:hypothetical protein
VNHLSGGQRHLSMHFVAVQDDLRKHGRQQTKRHRSQGSKTRIQTETPPRRVPAQVQTLAVRYNGVKDRNGRRNTDPEDSKPSARTRG